MLKKLVLYFFITGVFTSMVSGQIATPSLDQSIGVIAGTATPWRYFDSAGVYYITTVGEEKISDLKRSDFDGTLTGGNAVLFFDMFGFEVDLLSKLDFKYTGIDSTVGDRSIEVSKQNIYLTYRFGENFALAAESMKEKKKMDIVNSAISIAQEIEEAKTGFGASLRFMGPFFIAYGVRQVEVTGSGENSGSVPYTLKSSRWQETYFGVAMLTGAPGENQFRAEYSLVSSPETRKDGVGGNSDNHHQKTKNVIVATEVKLGNWLLRYQTETATQSDLTFKPGVDEGSSISTVTGIAFIQESGITVGVYQSVVAKTGKRNGSDIDQNDTGTSITLGIVF